MSIEADLKLEYYLLTQLHIDYDPSCFGNNEESTLSEMLENTTFDVDYLVSQIDENHRLFCSLLIEFGQEDTKNPKPLKYRCELFGTFSIDPVIGEEKINKLLPLNPVAILYGIARGFLGPIISRGPVGDYFLPTVNFYEVQKRKIQKHETSNASRKKRSTKTKKAITQKRISTPKKTVRKKKTKKSAKND